VKGLFLILVGAIVLLVSAGVAQGAESIKVERNIVYRNVDGVSLEMDIYQPESKDGKTPIIIYVHGGGWYSGLKSTGIGIKDIPELVKRGYTVASVDYRLGPRYKFPAQIEDLEFAVSFLRENASTYGLDASRIGVFGESAGGHLAALLGLTDENCTFGGLLNCSCCSTGIKAVIDICGPSDLTLFFEGNNSMVMDHIFGTTDPESEIIRQASPISYVTPDDPPFLLIHGDKDDVVPIDQSELIYEKLISAGVPVQLLTVQNCGHCLVPAGGSTLPSRADITGIMGDFFDQYLK
jgi:acetyl esterase/lipase